MKIIAYCMDWHINRSDAFRDLLEVPLSKWSTVEFHGWNGINVKLPKDDKIPLIFCMLPPSEDVLNTKNRNIFWVPMWDQAQCYDNEWWSKLPKSLNIIAFSEIIYQKAIKAGLNVIGLKYYKKPTNLKKVSWDKGKVLFYWNRVGLVGPQFLAELSNSLDLDSIIFKPDIDPRIDKKLSYDLPSIIGKRTSVKTIHKTRTREEFLELTKNSNIVLAPRLSEGVGMVYLEAMSRGACVIAHNAPTMNEYIINKHNGILIEKTPSVEKRTLYSIFSSKKTSGHCDPFFISNEQPWKDLSKINLRNMGDNAYESSKDGYAKWTKSGSSLIKFIQNSCK